MLWQRFMGLKSAKLISQFRFDTLPNTLSSNLNILNNARLVRSQRLGRSIIYTAAYDQMRELLAFLLEDCCGGSAEICAPLVAVASRACHAEGAIC